MKGANNFYIDIAMNNSKVPRQNEKYATSAITYYATGTTVLCNNIQSSSSL